MSPNTQQWLTACSIRPSSCPRSRQAFVKLDPRQLMRNPVIFVTEVVAALVTLFFLRDLAVGNGDAPFSGQIAVWLWFTVLFATFAEAVAEGRGKAQADSLRRTKSQPDRAQAAERRTALDVVEVPATDLEDRRHRASSRPAN